MTYKLYVSENCPGCHDVLDALTASKNAPIELVKVSSTRDVNTRRPVFAHYTNHTKVSINGIPTLEASNGMRVEGSAAILNFMKAVGITN